MKDIIYFLVSCIASALVFSMAFEGINMSRLKLFVPLQNMAMKTKKPKYMRILTIFMVIFAATILADRYNLSYAQRGIILGGAMSFIEIVFKTALGKGVKS